MFRFLLSALACLQLSSSAALAAPTWTEFRGQGGQSVAPDAKVPIEWDVESGKNIAWAVDLPGRGVSSPIVVGDRVVVTSSGGLNRTKMHVLCFDAASGKQLWHRQAWATGRTQCHPTMDNAAPTPASDGERMFAFYSSNDLVCYDLNGNLLWYRGLVLDHPRLGNDVGMSSSPVVAGPAVIVQCECQGDSFAAAIDRATGQTLWEVELPQGSNWASPVAASMQVDGVAIPAVLLSSSEATTVYNAADGNILWSSKIAGSSIPSPTAAGDLLLIPGGGLTAVRVNESGSPEVLWKSDTLSPGNPSPLLSSAGVCVVNRAGVLTVADPATGDVAWRKRLGGSYWATPVVVGSRMYALNDTGGVVVVDLNNKGEVLAENSMGEGQETLGSPAVAGDALYIRSHGRLWKVAPGASGG